MKCMRAQEGSGTLIPVKRHRGEPGYVYTGTVKGRVAPRRFKFTCKKRAAAHEGSTTHVSCVPMSSAASASNPPEEVAPSDQAPATAVTQGPEYTRGARGNLQELPLPTRAAEELASSVLEMLRTRGLSQTALCCQLSLSPVYFSIWLKGRPMPELTKQLYSAAIELWLDDEQFHILDPSITRTNPSQVPRSKGGKSLAEVKERAPTEPGGRATRARAIVLFGEIDGWVTSAGYGKALDELYDLGFVAQGPLTVALVDAVMALSGIDEAVRAAVVGLPAKTQPGDQARADDFDPDAAYAYAYLGWGFSAGSRQGTMRSSCLALRT